MVGLSKLGNTTLVSRLSFDHVPSNIHALDNCYSEYEINVNIFDEDDHPIYPSENILTKTTFGKQFEVIKVTIFNLTVILLCVLLIDKLYCIYGSSSSNYPRYFEAFKIKNVHLCTHFFWGVGGGVKTRRWEVRMGEFSFGWHSISNRIVYNEIIIIFRNDLKLFSVCDMSFNFVYCIGRLVRTVCMPLCELQVLA